MLSHESSYFIISVRDDKFAVHISFMHSVHNFSTIGDTNFKLELYDHKFLQIVLSTLKLYKKFIIFKIAFTSNYINCNCIIGIVEFAISSDRSCLSVGMTTCFVTETRANRPASAISVMLLKA
jgi:hypothetical protein